MRIWPVASALTVGGNVAIEGADARHITGVLRLGPGDVIKIADSAGKPFLAKIETANKTSVAAVVLREADAGGLRKPDISLGVAISKAPVMELVVQKAVELGCAGLYPLVTERSVGETLSPAKLARLRRIAHEACKQCGRADEMTVHEPVPLESLPEAEMKIFLWEDERNISLKVLLRTAEKVESVLALVGPAGGFSAEEAGLLHKSGVRSAGLGPLILRTETAAIALAALLDYHFCKLE
ncbi:MAG: 16S rRNA (uracil(1498)-N(3))-methyltransferase [Nitrospinae bacterium]|nr:16S rRNA (uracil(1498)-N(3))-methyltransferase [Nitrospinota bacterium]